MLCERCGHNDATIHYVEVINGVKQEHNLCSACASEIEFPAYTAMFELEMPLGQLIGGLLGLRPEAGKADEQIENLECPTCHMPYAEFVNNSKFGCPDCYRMFDLLMGGNIKNLQGSEAHVGKRPDNFTQEGLPSIEDKPLSVKEQIELLELKLKDALKEEDYELAVILRDQMKELRLKEPPAEPKESVPADAIPEDGGA